MAQRIIQTSTLFSQSITSVLLDIHLLRMLNSWGHNSRTRCHFKDIHLCVGRIKTKSTPPGVCHILSSSHPSVHSGLILLKRYFDFDLYFYKRELHTSHCTRVSFRDILLYLCICKSRALHINTIQCTRLHLQDIHQFGLGCVFVFAFV